jgi:hypothetical protein
MPTASGPSKGGTIHVKLTDSFWGRELRRTTDSRPPGIYRAKYTAEENRYDHHADIVIGKSVDPAKEAARLRRNARAQTTQARTRSPGIAGYLERENAATARLRNLREESLALATWLEGLPT